MKENHPDIKFGKTGVLLINLGTPDSTSWWDIRKYLKEFLSDRRVIEVNPILWKFILNLFILTFRPSKQLMRIKKSGGNKVTNLPYYFSQEIKHINLKMCWKMKKQLLILP